MSSAFHRWARLAAFAVAAIICSSAGAQAQTRTATEFGLVEGKLSADETVAAYLAIPYAAPPVEDLRWAPPQPPEPWEGVRSAKEFGSHCMQPAIFRDMVFRDPGQSEDCLTLNIWAPAQRPAAPLPVMVWIYGGGFNGGATSEPRQDGEAFARRGVILVSLNYRLGIFGFMASHELSAESSKGASGNYGLMDQAAALHWVQRNIAAFGGDPGNVTLFGESAGSISVSVQIASTWAKGTFVRAIGESGAAFAVSGLTFPPLAESQQKYEAYVNTVWGPDATLDKLRDLSAHEILQATSTRKDTPLFQPDIDGDFLTAPVHQLYADGPASRVPLIAGWNRNEAHAKAGVTAASFRAQAQHDFGPRADEFLRLYPAANDTQAVTSADALASDLFMGYCTWRWLDAASALAVPVYRYSFDLPSPGDAFHQPGTAFHSDEIEYVFGNLNSRKDATWRPQDRQLSGQMQSYWINFATTGNPNGPGLPTWPAYTGSAGWQVLHLDQPIRATPDAQRDRYLFLKQVWGDTALPVQRANP